MGETCASCKPFITEEDGVLKVRTCAWSPPGDHPVGCGMFIHVKDGKIVKVARAIRSRKAVFARDASRSMRSSTTRTVC